MINGLTYKRKTRFQIVLPILGIALILIIGEVLTISYAKDLLINERKREIKEMVESIDHVIGETHQLVLLDSLTVSEAQKRIIFIIKSAKYGNDHKDYYWLLDSDNQIIAHPYFENSESLKKANQKFSTTLEQLGNFGKRNRQGFINYKWQWKDDSTRIEDKISYVKHFTPWDWTLGTGFYYSDFDADIDGLIQYVTIIIIIASSIVFLLFFLVIRRSKMNIFYLIKSDQELSKSEKRFRNMSENLDNGLLILENNIVVYANQKILEILDINEFDKNLFQIESFLIGEEKIRYKSVKENLFDPNHPYNECSFWIKPNRGENKYITIHCTGEIIEDNVYNYMLVYDNTIYIKQESDLKIFYETFRQIPNSIVITDLEGKISYVNKNFEKATGYGIEDVKGKTPSILKSDKMSPIIYADLWKTITSGKIWDNELLNKKKNGDLFWERTIIFPIKNEFNEIINYGAVKIDLTEQRKWEEELTKSKKTAEIANSIKTAFLNNVSHEVNTPLNAILGFSQLLHAEAHKSERSFDFLSIIIDNAKILIKLFSDIMNYTSIESGNIKVLKTEIELEDLLHKITSRYNVKLITEEKKDVELVLNIPEQFKNAVLVSDQNWITQILEELIRNAIKFTEKGEIEIGYNIDYEDIAFYIKDTGVGIPDEEKQKIFDAFTHGKKIYLSLHKGTGLGLNIANGLAEYIGARLSYTSKEDQGSIFYLRLPSIDVKNYTIDNNKVEEFHHQNLLRQKRAIIAEDNEESFIYINSLISQELKELVRVVNGDELIKVLEMKGSGYDFVLINTLPQFDWQNNIRLIKNLYKNIKIIALNRDEIDRDKYRLDGQLVKPFSKNQLFALLTDLFA